MPYLTYGEFPTKFVYNYCQRSRQLRKRGISIRRLTYVPPSTGKLYYMMMLLTIQRGCTSYEINGKVYHTFHEACYNLGLLVDYKEYINAIIEASGITYRNQLRRLFITLLFMNTMSKPNVVWKSTWKLMVDEIVYERRRTLNVTGNQVIS